MPSVVSRIQDIMITEGADPRRIDLADVFAGPGLTYAVENSDGAVVSGASVDAAGVLTLQTAALGHSDLRVTATDAQGAAVQDVFRVRVAGPNAYTIAVLPDTQNYTSGNGGAKAETFYRMTEWLVDNKDAHRIEFVTHVGDITDDNLAPQWVIAERAMRTLDGQIPYSLLPGNHDQAVGGTAADHSTAFLDSLFSPAKQAATSPGTFGGVYDREPDRSANNFHTFTARDGTKWLVLSVEFGPRDDVLRWAGDVIGQHLDHRVFFLTHALTNWASRHDSTGLSLYDEGTGLNYGMARDPQGANDGEAMYRLLLSRFPNVSFAFSGHIFGDGAQTNVSTSQHGNPVFEMLDNYQNGVSREITGNGNEALGTLGGNGAIRLVVIDPDNRRLTTETYFTDFDDYLDGYRVKPELDRNGLTGYYRGHQETFTDVDLGPPALRAVADAGDDRIVEAEGAVAAVRLDASATLDPAGDAALFTWRDVGGELVATGRTATADLGVGRHLLTLSVTDTAGRVTTDQVRVIVRDAGTLLVETFDDGDAEGWVPPPGDPLVVGSPASFGLPELPGGTESVVNVPRLGQPATLLLNPNLGAPAGTLVGSYSLVFDILVPAGQGAWTALLQTNTANADDGELFIRRNLDGTGGIGIGGNYTGNFQYDAWQRVGFTLQENADRSITLNKYIQGVNVGTQALSGDRFRLDAGSGALLFTDNDGETSQLFASSALLTNQVLTAADMAALGGAKAGGILAAPSTATSAQFDFNEQSLAATFGPATLAYSASGGSSTGSFIVKGSAFAPGTPGAGDPPPQGTLFDQSDRPGNLLVWGAEAAKSWSAYVLEATIRPTDNDRFGLVFAYQDAANHYRLTLSAEANRRELVKVQDGVETVLAQVERGSPFDSNVEFRVAVNDGRIDAFVNERPVFGGPVFDLTRPLPGGSVGIFSDLQRSTLVDDITVNPIALRAFAGADRRVADTDGDGSVQVQLDGSATFGPAAIADWRWTDGDGAQVAAGPAPLVTLAPGLNALTLTATDGTGVVSTDKVTFDVVAGAGVLLLETFGAEPSAARWTFVDEGDRGGAGPNGTASSWSLAGGRLTQSSDLRSQQLEWDGASNPDLWLRGWSPLGDGVNALRLGTYARYDDPAAAAWTDYSVEARISTPDDDGLGFLFRYVDRANYYKLELDADGAYDSDPSNGAGSLFRLLRMQDGIESVLTERPGKYELGEAFTLRLDVVGGTMQAFLDDEAIFALPVVDRALPAGTIGLYSWGNAGVSFDDVTVLDLRQVAPAATSGIVLDGGNGADGVQSSAASFTPPISVETLLLSGAQAFTGAGTVLDNRVAGSAADILAGVLGDETLTGGLGAHAFVLPVGGGLDRAQDVAVGGSVDLSGLGDRAGAVQGVEGLRFQETAGMPWGALGGES